MKPTPGKETPFPQALTEELGATRTSDVEFAAAMGVSQATVVAWKKGRKGIRGKHLIKAIKILPGLGQRLGLATAAA